jgi:hypothetical protein
MKPTNYLFRTYVLVVIFSLLALAREAIAQDAPPDFSITESFLKKLYAGKSIQPVLRVQMDDRTNAVHPIDKDCEIHIAATPQQKLGDPPAIVVEPPNLCRFDPPSGNWPDVLDDKVMHKTCDVKGFLRIFTEHAQSSGGGANPNHVFEMHPALSIARGGDTLSFTSFLTVFEKMAAIKPSTATSCIEDRTLDVRYNKKQKRYEFREQGGRCGNFAIVEVTSTNKEWVRSIDGGHSAIVRVSADGKSRRTLKLYTLDGSVEDKWLDGIMKGEESSKRKLLHGLFTYDWYSIVTTVHTKSGTWLKPTKWTQVKFPLAFVVYGETQTVPWEED